jgi:hypothetical protein
VYLDDGDRYRISKIGTESVTLRRLGLNPELIIAFQNLNIADFERQLEGNLFNLEILNRRTGPAAVKETPAPEAEISETSETPR